jgi:hypothetical protein
MMLTDYIVVIKNAVPITLCDQILKEYINANDWDRAKVSKNLITDETVRNCSVLGISKHDVINKNYNARLNLDNFLYEIVSKCIEEYSCKFPFCSIENDTGYDLLEYKQGGFYKQHVDSFTQEFRTVSCSLLLNDDFEGGEFSFFNGKVIYKLKKGDALMFPSNFMYPHEVKTVTLGTRYSVITWFK